MAKRTQVDMARQSQPADTQNDDQLEHHDVSEQVAACGNCLTQEMR
jgi:hypothetical protein